MTIIITNTAPAPIQITAAGARHVLRVGESMVAEPSSELDELAAMGAITIAAQPEPRPDPVKAAPTPAKPAKKASR